MEGDTNANNARYVAEEIASGGTERPLWYVGAASGAGVLNDSRVLGKPAMFDLGESSVPTDLAPVTKQKEAAAKADVIKLVSYAFNELDPHKFDAIFPAYTTTDDRIHLQRIIFANHSMLKTAHHAPAAGSTYQRVEASTTMEMRSALILVPMAAVGTPDGEEIIAGQAKALAIGLTRLINAERINAVINAHTSRVGRAQYQAPELTAYLQNINADPAAKAAHIDRVLGEYGVAQKPRGIQHLIDGLDTKLGLQGVDPDKSNYLITHKRVHVDASFLEENIQPGLGGDPSKIGQVPDRTGTTVVKCPDVPTVAKDANPANMTALHTYSSHLVLPLPDFESGQLQSVRILDEQDRRWVSTDVVAALNKTIIPRLVVETLPNPAAEYKTAYDATIDPGKTNIPAATNAAVAARNAAMPDLMTNLNGKITTAMTDKDAFLQMFGERERSVAGATKLSSNDQTYLAHRIIKAAKKFGIGFMLARQQIVDNTYVAAKVAGAGQSVRVAMKTPSWVVSADGTTRMIEANVFLTMAAVVTDHQTIAINPTAKISNNKSGAGTQFVDPYNTKNKVVLSQYVSTQNNEVTPHASFWLMLFSTERYGEDGPSSVVLDSSVKGIATHDLYHRDAKQDPAIEAANLAFNQGSTRHHLAKNFKLGSLRRQAPSQISFRSAYQIERYIRKNDVARDVWDDITDDAGAPVVAGSGEYRRIVGWYSTAMSTRQTMDVIGCGHVPIPRINLSTGEQTHVGFPHVA
jgi:hypothetical protein